MIEVKIIDGKTCVRAKDLKPNHTNQKIYDQSSVNDFNNYVVAGSVNSEITTCDLATGFVVDKTFAA